MLALLAIGALASLQSSTRLFSPYAWGWLALQLDSAALNLGKISLTNASGILPDAPSDGKGAEADTHVLGGKLQVLILGQGVTQAERGLVGADRFSRAAGEEEDVAEIRVGFDEVRLELGRAGQRRHRLGEAASLGESDRFATERPRELQACRRQRSIKP